MNTMVALSQKMTTLPLFGKNYKVLVAEDYDRWRELIADIAGSLSKAPGLSDDTFEVTSVASADEAIAALEQEQFDVIITDNQMPSSGDGLRVLKKAAQQLLKPAMIMISANAGDKQLEAAVKETGALGILSKRRFDGELLFETISKALTQPSDQ